MSFSCLASDSAAPAIIHNDAPAAANPSRVSEEYLQAEAFGSQTEAVVAAFKQYAARQDFSIRILCSNPRWTRRVTLIVMQEKKQAIPQPTCFYATP